VTADTPPTAAVAAVTDADEIAVVEVGTSSMLTAAMGRVRSWPFLV